MGNELEGPDALRTLNAMAAIAAKLREVARSGTFSGKHTPADQAYMRRVVHIIPAFRAIIAVGIDLILPADIPGERCIHFCYRKATEEAVRRAFAQGKAKGSPGRARILSEPSPLQVRNWLLCIFGGEVGSLWITEQRNGDLHAFQPLRELPAGSNLWETAKLPDSSVERLRLSGFAPFTEVFGEVV